MILKGRGFLLIVPGNFPKMHVPNFGELSGSEDRGGVTTVSNSLIWGGWMTKVLKNGDKI